MSKPIDPFYNRKPIPDELIKDVGYTGLSAEQEFYNREKKYTANGVDVRRFSASAKGGFEPLDDPYYGRKRVSKAETTNVGETGLSPEEEYQNRERKYSVGGMDVRRFSKGGKNSLQPHTDPYYNRKMTNAAETVGVGHLDTTPAEQFEVRERKQSLFQLSSDPFDVIANRHRQSISGDAIGASAGATRRRSSAVAPHAAAAAAEHHHSGYDGEKLDTIVSRTDAVPAHSHNGESSTSAEDATHDTINPVTHHANSGHGTAAVTGTHGQPTVVGSTGHTTHYDAVTHGHDHHDPDSVAPHEIR